MGGGVLAAILFYLFGRGNSMTAEAPNPSLEPTADQLAAAANTSLALASAALDSVIAGARAASINTPARWSMWIAQTAHETGGYRYYRELWGPTAQQLRYENSTLADRLGNTEPGDGARYRGRGLIQLTGRKNYDAAGSALGLDLITNPDQAALAPGAGLVAAWYWNKHGLNKFADNNDVEGATKVINGGLTGIDNRQALYASASSVMGVSGSATV